MSDVRSPRPVEKEDLFRFQFLQSAKLSPDGRQVVYCVSKVDADKELETSALHLLSLETGKSRQFTSGTSGDMAPQWSPDGKQIAFLSARSGAPQVFVIAADGGEARQITSLKRGVSGAPLWSPDGSTIAFTSGGNAEPRDPKLPYRVTRAIYRFDAMGYLDDAVQQIYVVTAEGGEPRCLVEEAYQKALIGWSPDGKELLFQAMFLPDRHDLTPLVKAVSLEGHIREVLSGFGGLAVPAFWAPDGHIIFGSIPRGTRVGTKSDLWVMPGQGGEVDNRTPNLKIGVGGGLQADMPAQLGGSPILSLDGRDAFVQVQDGGSVHIYRVALQGAEEWKPVVTGNRACYPMDVQGDKLLYAVTDFNLPPDLYVCDLDGRNERRLTTLNEDLLRSLRLPMTERTVFPSADGVDVEGFLIRPPAGAPPYPTILVVHGGPYGAFGHAFHFDTQMLCGAGYAVLMVNHRASTGYGTEFSVAIDKNWGVKDYQDLMAGVDKMIALGLSDPDRLGVCGISGGGNLSCWIVGQTDRFRAAVPENPVSNWVSMFGVSDLGVWFAGLENGGQPHEAPEMYARQSPITFAHRCKTPTLLIQGETDYRCPAEQSEQFYATLKACGCVVEMIRMPNSFHVGSIAGPVASRKAQNDGLLGWMNKYVMGKE